MPATPEADEGDGCGFMPTTPEADEGDGSSFYSSSPVLSYQYRFSFLRHPSKYRTTPEGPTNRFLNFQDTSPLMTHTA